jgi:PAS domain S-box-containing protein
MGSRTAVSGCLRHNPLTGSALGSIDDPNRLAALEILGLMDSPPEASFDRFTRLAARLLNAPVALVTLLDADRQFIKSCVGLPEGAGQSGPVPESFCRYAVEADAPLLVDDARLDPRLRDNPSVHALGMVAYAGFPIRTPDGHVLGTLCVLDFVPRSWSQEEHQILADLADAATTEIAQRVHLAEQARSEAHYRRLVSASPYTIYALDAEGLFVELNRAGEALLERESGSVLGTHFGAVLAPEDLEETQGHFMDLARGLVETVVMEISLLRPSGERRRVSITATSILEDGRMTGVHGIARDITDTQELMAEMRLLHLALGSLSQGVSIVDESGRVVFVNRAYTEILGIGSAAAAQAYLDGLALDADGVAQNEEILRATREQGEWSGLVRRPRMDDGRRVPLDLFVSAVEVPQGRCIFTIVQDATDRLDRERHLRRAERLAGLGTLVGGVAHELNNPLTAIKGFSSLMLMDPRTPDDREALEVMKREADRAAQIVANLRRLARGTQEEDTPRERVDLNDVVGHVLQVRGYSLDTHNVTVDTDLDPALPAILGDRGQMEQVVLNLVVNAEQALAGRAGPRLTLRTLRCERGVTVQVTDNGPGIPAVELERIFDPFFTTKAPGEGMGLGLALVHGMVADHGGRVHVDSVAGEGTTFRIDFPRAADEVRAEAPAPAADAPPPRSLRVLVVDDEDSIRRTLARYLGRRGHRVSVAAEGGEALRLLEEAEDGFDVILSDVRMPGLSGDRLHARLRERGDGMDRRLVFMSGDALGDQTADALSGTEAPVILKPFDMGALAETVEAVGQGV